MLINVFDSWFESNLITKIIHGNRAPLQTTHESNCDGASIILSSKNYYLSPGYTKDTPSACNDFIWFKNKSCNEVAEEINKQIKANIEK